MRNRLRIAAAALAAALLLPGCDSFPGVVEIERPQEGSAILRVRNIGDRTLTMIEIDPCPDEPGGVRANYRVQLRPQQEWSRGFPAACHIVRFDFDSGGGWSAGMVVFSEEQPTLISPW